MTVPSQLFQLQETDTEIDSGERAVQEITRQLADNKAETELRAKLAVIQQKLDEMKKEQRTTEWEIDDLAGKLKTIDEQLYSGRIRNPKELTDLQHESDLLKARKRQVEDRDLETMEQVEQATREYDETDKRLKTLLAEREIKNAQLKADLERTQQSLAAAKQKRENQAAAIEPRAIAIYQDARKKRGTAVAKVEQGLCMGCRIALPVADFQRAKAGELVQCGSCGRALFFS